ncbi:TIGR03032 family protein [Pseudomonadales bacterium]|nr:TIGR03032 family protein [Pseudomonadales bacterium]
MGADGKPVFINTLFSCLATVSDTHSFKPLWQPSFISDLQPEDRCHLNGLAMKDGAPAYVTAISTTNVNEGWREHRQSGGVVIDIESNEIVGAAFHGNFAILGLSRPRDNKTFNGLALDERLEKEQIAARSGLVVVDLTTGGIPHSLNAEGFISELYDVVVLPGVKRPSMIGFKNDQIRRVLSIE